MPALKLNLDEFDEIDYFLIAIHSSLEDFKLAYLINQKLPVLLSRNNDDVTVLVKEGEAFFSKYSYQNESTNEKWSLIQNKNDVRLQQKYGNQLLLLDSSVEISRAVYLIEEHKKVDYFLKIENNCVTTNTQLILEQLKQIKRITAVYRLIPENIKSKNNLIF